MSKTSQRRDSAFHLGRKDGEAGRPFRWIRHPHIKLYGAGHRAGTKYRLDEIKFKKRYGLGSKRRRGSFLVRLVALIKRLARG